MGMLAVPLYAQQPASPPPPPKGPFTLPKLPYAHDALEPHIDAQTMEIHHTRHHQAYVNNANAALAKYPDWARRSVDDILKNLSSAPEDVRTALRNNAGGHSNHSLFWQMMKKGGGGSPSGELAKAIDAKFGSLPAMQEQFNRAATTQFGSGWAWLTSDGKELRIESTPNQDSPITAGRVPLLGLDVWEHAYYLKYQNRRPDYIKAWWNVVNWDYVAERLKQRS
jgi:superoxide dismutase, Fe-Mn family